MNTQAAVRELFDRTFTLSAEQRVALLEHETQAASDTEVLERTRRLLTAATVMSSGSRPARPEPPSSPPEQVGRYEILGVLGQGGFGIVYSGRDTVLKRPVAIKTCISDDPELRERFVHEAEISAGLQHPNVVTIYDFGVEDGLPYLVQELLSGEDMSETIQGRSWKSKQLERRLKVLVGVADGLAHAHRHGVVHRDVKPSNVRLTDTGDIKLLDFGIAELLHQHTDLVSEDGTAAGTVGYLAPEQLNGDPVGKPADVFSFGALAFEWLCGHRAFPGKAFAEIGYSLLFNPVDLQSMRSEGVPEPLVQLVSRCLEKDAANRFADASAVAESLRQVMASLEPSDSEPIQPIGVPAALDPTPTRPLPATGWKKRRQILTGIVAALGIGLVVTILLLLGNFPPDPVAPADSETHIAETAGPNEDLVSLESADGLVADQDQTVVDSASLEAASSPNPATAAEGQELQEAGRAADSLTSDSAEIPTAPPEIREASAPGLAEAGQAKTDAQVAAPQSAEPTLALPGLAAGDDFPQGTSADLPASPDLIEQQQLAGSEPDASELDVEADNNASGESGASGEPRPAEPSADGALAEEASTDSPSESVPVAEDPSSSEADRQAESPSSTLGVAVAKEAATLYVDGEAGVVAPRPIDPPSPEYPRRARRRRLATQVVIAILVDRDGRVVQTLLERRDRSGMGFNEAAEEAARQTLFKPATKNGVPGTMWARLIFDFKP